MYKKIAFCVLAGLFISGCHKNARPNSSKESFKKPFDFMFMQRAYPTGAIKADAVKTALKGQEKGGEPIIWELVGPDNIGGRVTDIEIPFDQNQEMYVGTASGGVFKTFDAGLNWNPIFDHAESISIGDIEISKNNSETIWVGTGEVNAGGGSLAYDGNGLYKSEDGGLNWVNKGLNNVGSISKVIIDPNNDDVIFAAAMGALFKNDTLRGIYKSTDDGSSWEHVFFISDSTGIIDLVCHPDNSDILYAAAWERIRRPQYRSYGGETSGIYRSIDGGNTWGELTDGLPSLGSQKGRISIAIAKTNPEVLYTRYADASGNIQGVFKTTNGGDTWIEINSVQLTNIGFHWWFKGVYVDPSDENVIYNLDFVVQKSIDGGNSWSGVFPNVHVDQHALAFDPENNNKIVLGNDGGLFNSNDGGNNYTKYMNLPITQFYRMSVDPQDINRVYGGSQDNGTIRTTTGNLSDWNMIFGGDGFQCLVDPTNTNVIYAEYQYGNLSKSVNNGATFFSATNGISNSDRNNWDTPVAMDPQSPQILYYGTQRLWKTINGGNNWSAISQDLTNGDGGGNLNFGTITTIDVSRVNGDFIVIGTDDSNVWVTQNGGSSWSNVSDNLPNLWATKVLTDPSDLNTVYITFSGYRYGENLGHVFKTTDGGLSWIDIGQDLPDLPVNDIIKDEYGNLYIGTDIGIYASHDDGLSWLAFGENIPNVPVTDLYIQEAEKVLFAATYGRSIYKKSIQENPLSIFESSPIDNVLIYPNPSEGIVNVKLPENVLSAHIYFFNALGRVVYDKKLNHKESAINTSELTGGIYYVKISANNNSSIVKLMIK
ncbi:T9SS type A sorting domain-containing protein [Crocinitomicaceae bacterium]|nr:T9SS type A sorting domain-containing protein [Crocinitomicaceae bacterium]